MVAPFVPSVDLGTLVFFDQLQVDVVGGAGRSNLVRCRGVVWFGGIFGAVVRWKNEFKVVLCQILTWINCGSYPVMRSFK